MFDLESEIKQWRAELARTGLSSGEVVDELESHLREQFARIEPPGVGDAEKFQIAVARLGEPKNLKREFSKTRWRRIWGRRDNPVELKFLAGWFILMGLSYLWLLPGTIRMGFAIPPVPWPKLSLSTALSVISLNFWFALQLPIGFGLLHRRRFWRVLAVGWTSLFFLFCIYGLTRGSFRYGMFSLVETSVTGSHWIFLGIRLPVAAMSVVGLLNCAVLFWGLFLLLISPTKHLFRSAKAG